MKIPTKELLSELKNRTESYIREVQAFQSFTDEQLRWRSDPGSWNILECVQHLNLYAAFYHPEIETRIRSSKYPSEAAYKPGLLGNYFAQSMLPKEQLNKMKTFKVMNPIDQHLDISVLDRFIQSQYQILELLDKAAAVSLGKTRTGISISKWIKLKLGDTLRVVIYHNYRHIVQAKKIAVALKAGNWHLNNRV